MAIAVVAAGDCLSSIAARAWLPTDAVWAANAELAARRDNPNVLQPGDLVTVPDPVPKQLGRTTDRRHVFHLRTEPTLLRLQLLRADLQPRAGLEYALCVDGGEALRGTTDGDGRIEQTITPTAIEVIVSLVENGREEAYRLPLGTLVPIDSSAGVQQRLLNLGFDCGQVDGAWGKRSRAAMRQFQALRGLRESGERDAASLAELLAVHGC